MSSFLKMFYGHTAHNPSFTVAPWNSSYWCKIQLHTCETMLSLGFFLLSTKEMGTNEVLLLLAASNKMPKDTNIIIISFLSCLIYVNTGLSLGLVAFYA